MGDVGQGLPGLYCEIHWGSELTEARTFTSEVEEIVAAASEDAPMPLYGFTLAGERHLLARRTARGYRIYPPPGARLEKQARGDAAVTISELAREGGLAYFDLEDRGTTVTLIEGDLRLVIRPSVAVKKLTKMATKDLVTVAAVAFVFLAAPIAFLVMGSSSPERAAEFNARALEQARQETQARKAELERLYPSLPSGSVDAGDDVKRRAVPASVSVN